MNASISRSEKLFDCLRLLLDLYDPRRRDSHVDHSVFQSIEIQSIRDRDAVRILLSVWDYFPTYWADGLAPELV